MRGRYYLPWVAALSISVAVATAGPPANAPATNNATTKSATSGTQVPGNDTAHGDVLRRSLDLHTPLCETATYINALDLLVYLAMRPASGLQNPILHQTDGAVYNQVFIQIYGTSEIAALERNMALDGLYKGLEYLSVTGGFYAMTQETINARGRVLAVVQFSSAYWTSPSTPLGAPLAVTKPRNVTELDHGSCKRPSAIADPEGASNTSIADMRQPATNNSDIDALLESPTSIEQPANDTDSSSNDDWFIWEDPNEASLKMKCRFLPGLSLPWNEAYMPFAHYIWNGEYSYERGLDNPATAIDKYNLGAHLHFRVGGAPTGKAITPGFTNRIALMSLGRIPRIQFEKKTWTGIQVQVLWEEVNVGVIVLLSDRMLLTGDMDQNTPESSVDVA